VKRVRRKLRHQTLDAPHVWAGKSQLAPGAKRLNQILKCITGSVQVLKNIVANDEVKRLGLKSISLQVTANRFIEVGVQCEAIC
jgi:hypothetical protein